MRNWNLIGALFLLVAFAFSADLKALEPADNIIANAQADLERYQSQAGKLSPGQSAGANRILKLMSLSLERLQGSPNQADPSWIEVNDHYLSLQSQLENFMNPDKASAASLAAASATPPPTPAPARSAGVSTQSSRPAAVAAEASGDPAVPALVSGQRVQVKKLARDLANSRANIVTTGPSQFQDPGVVASRQEYLQQYTDAIARYPQLDDPDVQAARAEYIALREALTAEFERAKAQLAQLGDVQTLIKQLDENRRNYPVPKPLTVPFSAEDAKQWASAAGSARTVAEHNATQTELIIPLAYLPKNPGTVDNGSPYDSDNLMALNWGAADMLNELQVNYEIMATGLTQRMNSMNDGILQRWQEDPTDDEKRWLFIAEGKQQEAEQVYSESRDIVNSSIYLEQALGRDSAAANAMLAKLDQAEADFNRKRQIALASSRLPEPATSNPEMMKIAENILSKPDYEFGQHGAIILTTREIVERERKDSEIDINDAEITSSGNLKMSGSETIWTYKWQEFKFATPLKEADSDTWYIWWITARNFSSGGNNTPLNQWISGGTTKGNPILPENM